mmetsp:Transcript_13007/g.26461  ORF Transcript_13007/g.26461 Transcript_13007/m.26461 type:complete len:651 (+) Transcript_13007:80-2032(+)
MDNFGSFMLNNNGNVPSNDGLSYDVFGSGNLERGSNSTHQVQASAPSLLDRQGNSQWSQSAQGIIRTMMTTGNFGSGGQFGDSAATAPSYLQNGFVGTPDNLSTGSGASARRVSEPESRRNSTITMGMQPSNISRSSMISSTSNSNFSSVNNSGGGFYNAESGSNNNGCGNFNNGMTSAVMNRLVNANSISGQGDISLMMNPFGFPNMNANDSDASFPNTNTGSGSLRNILSNNCNMNPMHFANNPADFNFSDGSNFPNNFSARGNDMNISNQMMTGTNTNTTMASPISEAPLVIPPKKTKNKLKQTFAQKLMHILSIKECQNAIRWMPDGTSFCIVDSKELVDKVLPAYFKEAKYTSFTRKLNRWGFKHFTVPTKEGKSETSVYTHPKFQRDCPELCESMDGGHRRRSSASRASGISTLSTSASAGLQNQLEGNTQQGHFPQNIPQQYSLQQQLHLQEMIQQEQQNRLLNSLSAQGGASDNNASDVIFGNLNINSNLLNSFQNSAVVGNNLAMAYLPSSNRHDTGFASFGGDTNHTSGDASSAVSNMLAGDNHDEFDQFPKTSFSNFNVSNDFNQGGYSRNAEMGKMHFDTFSASMASGNSGNYGGARQGNDNHIDDEHDSHLNALRGLIANESHRMMLNFDSKPASQG